MVLLAAVSFARLIDVHAKRQGGVVTVDAIRAEHVLTILPLAPAAPPLHSHKCSYLSSITIIFSLIISDALHYDNCTLSIRIKCLYHN